MRAVRVIVPATSANLGPGFDALGLALGMHDVLEARTVPEGPELSVSVEGVGAQDVPRDETHLVVRAMQWTFDVLNTRPPPLHLACRNAIPHGRGLGSSAAAIVGGVLAARALVPGGPEVLDDESVLAVAAELEGHPDNVAPCLLGGATIAWATADRARAVRIPIHPDLRPIMCVPDQAVPTEAARGLLPQTVPHPDAVHTAARTALLVEALRERPDLLLEATDDRLHQPYRAAAMPETAATLGRLRAAGYPAVLSGAGPAVLVLASPADQPGSIRQAMGSAAWQVLELAVDHRGALAEMPAESSGHDGPRAC
ncbi:MAG: homoserine kinase [Jiangellaceae bacterium]|nr:homoserine kinase [Jiangellaceae bacterium]